VDARPKETAITLKGVSSMPSFHALTQSLAAATITLAVGIAGTSAQAALIDHGPANSAAAEAVAPDAAHGAGNLAIAWTWTDGGITAGDDMADPF
jgi:hypothetical protein